MKIETMEQFEQLLNMLDRHRISQIEVDGIKLTRDSWSQPIGIPMQDVAPTSREPSDQDENDLLYWSADHD